MYIISKSFLKFINTINFNFIIIMIIKYITSVKIYNINTSFFFFFFFFFFIF